MVFEDIVKPIGAKKHPLKLFLYGVIFSVLSVAFSLWIFKEQASLVMVFLTVVMVMPLMYFTLRDEEEWDWKGYSERKLFSEHNKAIRFLLFMFIGFVVGYTLFYLFLPDVSVREVFEVQLKTISDINNNVSGNVIGTGTLMLIFENNLKVLFFCLIFAFFFGAGAIFILAWNASVISAAIGTFFRNAISDSVGLFGFTKGAVYFQFFFVGILRYLTHGIFEIAAYFFGALAGGIVSMAFIRHSIKESGFKNVIIDASVLTMVALLLLVVGAFVEVYVTPLLF